MISRPVFQEDITILNMGTPNNSVCEGKTNRALGRNGLIHYLVGYFNTYPKCIYLEGRKSGLDVYYPKYIKNS